MEVWVSNQDLHNEKKELIGTAIFDSTGADRYESRVSLWLPDTQSVFAANPHRQGRILFGPMAQTIHRKGVYRSTAGTIERPISVLLSPNILHNKIGGVMNGKQYIDLDSNQ
jgi:hypothetical protein